MSDKKQWREFWLQECTNKQGNTFMCDLVNLEPEKPSNKGKDKFNELHVIEIGAVRELEERIAKLEAKAQRLLEIMYSISSYELRYDGQPLKEMAKEAIAAYESEG